MASILNIVNVFVHLLIYLFIRRTKMHFRRRRGRAFPQQDTARAQKREAIPSIKQI